MAKEIISGIYSITNKINKKVYIGSSKNIEDRWKKHRNLLTNNKHHSTHLQNAWNKHGEENFVFEIVEVCDENMLLEREQYYINTTGCYNRDIGYNIMTSATMNEIPKEIRDKISQSLTGEYCGEKSATNIYTEKQAKDIINDLLNPHLKLQEIADRNNTPVSVVSNIYTKNSWRYLTKDIVFPKRDTVNNNSKLSKEDILNIINMIMSGENDSDIAERYNVNRKTISDIRHHKTWTKYTDNINFPSSDGLRRGACNNMSKLTEEDVREIKVGLSNNVSMSDLSRRFNVTAQAISNIKNGKAYSYIKI